MRYCILLVFIAVLGSCDTENVFEAPGKKYFILGIPSSVTPRLREKLLQLEFERASKNEQPLRRRKFGIWELGTHFQQWPWLSIATPFFLPSCWRYRLWLGGQWAHPSRWWIAEHVSEQVSFWQIEFITITQQPSFAFLAVIFFILNLIHASHTTSTLQGAIGEQVWSFYNPECLHYSFGQGISLQISFWTSSLIYTEKFIKVDFGKKIIPGSIKVSNSTYSTLYLFHISVRHLLT